MRDSLLTYLLDAQAALQAPRVMLPMGTLPTMTLPGGALTPGGATTVVPKPGGNCKPHLPSNILLYHAPHCTTVSSAALCNASHLTQQQAAAAAAAAKLLLDRLLLTGQVACSACTADA